MAVLRSVNASLLALSPLGTVRTPSPGARRRSSASRRCAGSCVRRSTLDSGDLTSLTAIIEHQKKMKELRMEGLERLRQNLGAKVMQDVPRLLAERLNVPARQPRAREGKARRTSTASTSSGSDPPQAGSDDDRPRPEANQHVAALIAAELEVFARLWERLL